MSEPENQLRIFDSLLRRKVDFVPRVPGEVGMYVCGLTVQDAPHIGHARSAIAFDVIRRYLAWRGLGVRFVRNITDIDDKIIRRAAERAVTPATLAQKAIDDLHAEMAALSVLPPDVEPRVTESIAEIVALTERLVAGGKAYAAGGDVYYAVASFTEYGALSGQSTDDLRSGARVEPGEHKRSPLDFALWKAAKPGEPEWDSPWGPGRPGWHIECSAMALRHLGPTFDIHGGGSDLIFPHHENEIAQSQGALGPSTFARLWMHNGLLNLREEKMSKSLGNFWLISDVRRSHAPEGIRYHLVQHHYRAPIQFEVAERDGAIALPGIEDAERRVDYLYTTLARIDDFVGARTEAGTGPVAVEAERLLDAFRAAMDDDFNTSVAVAELGEAARAANRLLDDPASAPKDVRRRSLARLGRDLRAVGGEVLGFLAGEPRAFLHARRARLAAARGIDPEAVAARLRERDEARKGKDFARADAVRAELNERGIEVMDGRAGADWRVSEG